MNCTELFSQTSQIERHDADGNHVATFNEIASIWKEGEYGVSLRIMGPNYLLIEYYKEGNYPPLPKTYNGVSLWKFKAWKHHVSDQRVSLFFNKDGEIGYEKGE